jgi:solute carrier family 13 (sodium-dependent dicarboxylate transporter), member 2/3/5
MTRGILRVMPTSNVRRSPLPRLAGPAGFVLLTLAGPEAIGPEGRRVLGVALWMIIWWLGEAVPIAATSLLPLVLFPLLGIATLPATAAPYANELIFLFLAGFLLAAALESWRAHERIALRIVAGAGSSARGLVLALMVATAFISMWISNTATAAMMYPIAIATGALFGDGDEARGLRTALMLGVAYAASIGGMGTLLGTPPNLIFAASARTLLGQPVSFAGFMLVGVPLVLVLLPLCWALLVFVLHRGTVPIGPGVQLLLAERRAALGPIRGGERMTLAIFAATALAWVLRERKDFGRWHVPGLVDLLPGLTDAAIGLTAAVLLLVLDGRAPDGSRRPLLRWSDARAIPWDVLLLFGAGLSLAAALESSGVTRAIAGAMGGLSGAPTPLVLGGLALTVLALSELASNTAVAAMAMPLAVSLAAATGQPPLLLTLVAALAASAGFALPVATPPNAIFYASGQIPIRAMARAGLLLDLLAVVAVVAVAWALYPFVVR